MRNMRNWLTVALLAGVAGCNACGHVSRDNELTGQVKKLVHNTPIVCPDYTTADISLGVVKNGAGSVSKDDVWLQVMNQGDADKLKQAAQTGALVTVKYDVARLSVCWDHHQISAVEFVK